LDNPSQAFEALEKFVSNAPSNIYDEQIEIAQEYLKTIKKEFVQKTSPVGI
jgi:hypothetical protein